MFQLAQSQLPVLLNKVIFGNSKTIPERVLIVFLFGTKENINQNGITIETGVLKVNSFITEVPII